MKELKRLVASLKLLGVVAKIENTEIETLPNGTKVETFEAVSAKIIVCGTCLLILQKKMKHALKSTFT